MGGDQLLFRERRCHARDCGALFYICRSCFRGQRYCSEACRQLTRRDQRRAANRRHQQSPEGRLDHRDRQRAYRLARLLVRVTDQGSGPPRWSGSIAAREPIRTTRPHAAPVCCVVCGRKGLFIETFTKRE